MRSAPSRSDLAPPATITPWRGKLEALAPAFEALEEPARPGAIFRSWSWISAWWNTFSARREPLVLVAHAADAGGIVGLLPLFAEPTPLGGRRLALMGEGIVGSDYLGLVCRAADEPSLAQAFADYCATAQYDELCLDGLADADPLARALVERLPPARLTVEPRFRCPHLRLAGRFDDYLARLPDGTGAQWRRRRRWLEKRPGFAIDVATAPDDVVAALDTLFVLHRRRWARDGGSDAIDKPEVEDFHRCAARLLAERGWVRLYVLSADGAARAALYGWRLADRFVFYQCGYDPDWQQRSVGTVLLGQVIRDCFADGVTELDLLRGTEPYKLRWANGCRDTVRLRAGDGSWRARLHDAGRTLYGQLRAAGKRALPATTLDWARRARRRVSR
jgi:CelD/BcsL family acetyltransferase involved in cellulose biosynthesis